MTEKSEVEELSEIIKKIKIAVKETRSKCTKDLQLEILDDVERELSRKMK